VVIQPDLTRLAGIGIWELPAYRSMAHLLLSRGVIQRCISLGVNNTAINVQLW